MTLANLAAAGRQVVDQAPTRRRADRGHHAYSVDALFAARPDLGSEPQVRRHAIGFEAVQDSLGVQPDEAPSPAEWPVC
jgi:hypothetical protein